MSEPHPIVFVIDDDSSVREALKSLIRSVGLQVELFGSTQEFRRRRPSDNPNCLVLDIRLPGKSGLDFQRELAAENIHTPIIFITGHGDIPMSVQAMKGGAIEFLTKPFRDQDLIDAINLGLEREREVLPLIISGRLNKQVAAEVGISEATAKVHRSQLMRKLGADSLADLVRMAEKMGIPLATY